MNSLFDIIKNRLEKIGISYPLEKEEYSLTYGKIFLETEMIWCGDYIHHLSIESGRGFVGDLLYCRDDTSHNRCTYQLDSKNRLVSKDKTKNQNIK